MATTQNGFMGFNPFTNVDVTKFMGELKMPKFDIEALMAAQRKNVEAFTEVNRLAYEGAQALAQRQMDIVKGSVEDITAAVTDLVAAGSPEDKASKQTDVAKRAFEKAVVNFKDISELFAKNNQLAFDALTKRVGEQLEEVKDMIAKAKA